MNTSSCVPAHKQTDPAKKPGQIKNDIVVVKATPERPKDVTLGDYIERKEVDYAPKLTFNEWFTKNWDWSLPLHQEDIEEVWYASRENM